jgi:hypothetical protein
MAGSIWPGRRQMRCYRNNLSEKGVSFIFGVQKKGFRRDLCTHHSTVTEPLQKPKCFQ